MADNRPTTWLSGAISTELPTGYPISFGGLKLAGTWGNMQRNAAGTPSFANCTITCKSAPVSGLNVYSPLLQFANYTYRALPDWQRSPTGWQTWNFDFLVEGDSDAVMAYQSEFASRQGYAWMLRFSGADSLFDQVYSQFYSKECRAEMGPIGGIQEYTMVTPSPTYHATTIPHTHVIISATFQQLSAFTVVS